MAAADSGGRGGKATAVAPVGGSGGGREPLRLGRCRRLLAASGAGAGAAAAVRAVTNDVKWDSGADGCRPKQRSAGTAAATVGGGREGS